MTGIVERNYSEALFAALNEDKQDLSAARNELNAVRKIVAECDGFEKLMDSPTVSAGEKLTVVKEAFDGKVSRHVLNFLCIVTEGRRWDSFSRICDSFGVLCNEHLGIAEITVTTAFPLSEEQRAAIKSKMAQVTGKKIEMSEKTDKSIVGGIVVDYGDTRLDGSVKTRLEGLKESFSRLIG